MEHIPFFMQSGRSGFWIGTMLLTLAVYSVRHHVRRVRAVAARAAKGATRA